MEWFKKAAVKGNSVAQYHLGIAMSTAMPWIAVIPKLLNGTSGLPKGDMPRRNEHWGSCFERAQAFPRTTIKRSGGFV